MTTVVAYEELRTVNAVSSVSVLVKQAGSAGEMLDRGLRAAGLRVVAVPTVYDVMATIERSATPVRHLVLDVDCFGRDEFRLIPVVCREWPDTVIVAYHSPGFEYKGRIAELVGADIVLATAADVSRFAQSLAPNVSQLKTTGRPEPAAKPSQPPPPPKAGNNPVGQATTEEAQPPGLAPVAAAVRPTPQKQTEPAPRPVQKPPAAGALAAPTPGPQPESDRKGPEERENVVEDGGLDRGHVLGTIELTDEELRLLLGEDDAG